MWFSQALTVQGQQRCPATGAEVPGGLNPSFTHVPTPHTTPDTGHVWPGLPQATSGKHLCPSLRGQALSPTPQGWGFCQQSPLWPSRVPISTCFYAGYPGVSSTKIRGEWPGSQGWSQVLSLAFCEY